MRNLFCRTRHLDLVQFIENVPATNYFGNELLYVPDICVRHLLLRTQDHVCFEPLTVNDMSRESRSTRWEMSTCSPELPKSAHLMFQVNCDPFSLSLTMTASTSQATKPSNILHGKPKLQLLSLYLHFFFVF